MQLSNLPTRSQELHMECNSTEFFSKLSDSACVIDDLNIKCREMDAVVSSLRRKVSTIAKEVSGSVTPSPSVEKHARFCPIQQPHGEIGRFWDLHKWILHPTTLQKWYQNRYHSQNPSKTSLRSPYLALRWNVTVLGSPEMDSTSNNLLKMTPKSTISSKPFKTPTA